MAKIFIIIFTCICFIPLYAQQQISQGSISDLNSNASIPFVHIIENGGEKHYIADADGNFTIPRSAALKSLTFRQHLYRDLTFYFEGPQDSLPSDIKMHVMHYFYFNEDTDDTTMALMDKVVERQYDYCIQSLAPVTYNTYSKYILSMEKIDKANSLLKKLRKKLPNFIFHDFKAQQHFFIMESVTERRYLNDLHQKESIVGARSSSLHFPSLFIQGSHLQDFSVYDNYVTIAGSSYIGPFSTHNYSRYAFKIIDTAYVNDTPVYIVKYNPRPDKLFNGIKGLLYINGQDYAVQYVTASPAKDQKLAMYIYQTYEKHENIWFPARKKTVIAMDRFGTNELKLTASGNIYYYNLKPNAVLKKRNFDEVILEYKPYSNRRDEEFWINERKESFTLKDSNTYLYFRQVDRKKKLEQLLRAGERIYYGQIPYRSINIDLNKVITFNHLEGTRLGFGAHTNERFSERYMTGGYVGFGFLDKKPKFGADFTYHLHPKSELDYNFAYNHDVREAGAAYFSFDRVQYSSEPLRKYRLRILDYVDEIENSLSAHPLKYLNVRATLRRSWNLPSYDYQFRDHSGRRYSFAELGLSVRYAFGEKMLKLSDYKISLGSKYPTVYFQLWKGMKDFLGSDYNYTKFDVKIEQNFKSFLLGTTGIQLLAGATSHNTPYFRLWNGKGSLRQPSVVIHNSFETMRYNEFLSDRYIAFFLSHNFGKIYLKRPNISPSLLLIHNFGYGSLKHPEYHKGLAFKTMEKGYYETGMFLDNVLVINLNGLKTGLGSGFFLRYGPYALTVFKHNVVVKVSVNFMI